MPYERLVVLGGFLKKAKYIALSAIIIVLLLVSPIFRPNGNYRANTADGNVYWMEVAQNAWSYFQPGKGVDANTGLHGATLNWPYFTDWDLGTYIQAIIDANKMGILEKAGAWGADERLNKLLTFLESRELTVEGLPYQWYESRTGRKWGEGGGPDLIDTGKLLVALQNLRLHRSDLAERINRVVYERTNYSRMWTGVDGIAGSNSIYAYYVAKGFAVFWSERFTSVAEGILNSIISSPEAETYGVKLPMSQILCDPLLSSVFELKPDYRLLDLVKRVYLAHEAKYNATGKFVAFSEGNTGLDDPSYAYEWVVTPSGKTWVIRGHGDSDVQLTPIVYFKVAVGFFALYNTEFTRDMLAFLEANLPQPSSGYVEGIDDNGRVVATVTDKTNGLTIGAARYASENSNQTATQWQNGDLSVFPRQFIQNDVVNNITIVMPESRPHGPVGASQTIDNLGVIFIAERLARESTSGTLRAAIDDQLVKFDPNSGNVTLLDKTTNLIVVGNPGINVVSYYYNSLRDSFGKPLVPVLFQASSTESYGHLYVPTSGSVYGLGSSNGKSQATDYGVIMVFKDQFGRYVALVYGLGSEGTSAASEVLRDYDKWRLSGSAVILKLDHAARENGASEISVVEKVP
jgi:hypothetical protein